MRKALLSVLMMLFTTLAVQAQIFSFREYRPYEIIFSKIDSAIDNYIRYSTLRERKSVSPEAMRRFRVLFATGATIDDDLCIACGLSVKNKSLDAYMQDIARDFPRGFEEVALLNAGIDYSNLASGTVKALLQRRVMGTASNRKEYETIDNIVLTLHVGSAAEDVLIEKVTWLQTLKRMPDEGPLPPPAKQASVQPIAVSPQVIPDVPVAIKPHTSGASPFTIQGVPISPVVAVPPIVDAPSITAAKPSTPPAAQPTAAPVAKLPTVTAAQLSAPSTAQPPAIPATQTPIPPTVQPSVSSTAQLTTVPATQLSTAPPPAQLPTSPTAQPVVSPPPPPAARVSSPPAPSVRPRPVAHNAPVADRVPRLFASVGLQAGTLSGNATASDFAGNYPNSILAQTNIGEIQAGSGSTFGFDAQLEYYFGKARTFGVGAGILFLRQKRSLHMDHFAVDYQSFDKNGSTFRQRITAGQGGATEEVKMSSISIPLVLKLRVPLSEKLSLMADAGILYNLQAKTSYTTDASFNYEAFYLFDANGNAIYDDGATPDSHSWMISQGNYEAHGKDGQTVEQYFESFSGYNVGLNKKPAAGSGSSSYRSGSIGFILQPTLAYKLSQRLWLNAGPYFISQSFRTGNDSNAYRITEKMGSYCSLQNGIEKIRHNSIGFNLGLKVAL